MTYLANEITTAIDLAIKAGKEAKKLQNYLNSIDHQQGFLSCNKAAFNTLWPKISSLLKY